MWTDAALAQCKEWWSAGYSAAQCSRLLALHFQESHSRNAVIGKMHRAGLARSEAARSRPRQAWAPKPPPIVKPTLPPVVAPPDPTKAVLLESALAEHCRYPLWGHAEPINFLLCGEKIFLRPYCAFHARVCFSPEVFAPKRGRGRPKREDVEQALEAVHNSGILRALG